MKAGTPSTFDSRYTEAGVRVHGRRVQSLCRSRIIAASPGEGEAWKSRSPVPPRSHKRAPLAGRPGDPAQAEDLRGRALPRRPPRAPSRCQRPAALGLARRHGQRLHAAALHPRDSRSAPRRRPPIIATRLATSSERPPMPGHPLVPGAGAWRTAPPAAYPGLVAAAICPGALKQTRPSPVANGLSSRCASSRSRR
jgi:hypothetical protein